MKRAAHPGEILKDELAEIGVTPTELARQIDVPANRTSQIINGKRSVSPSRAIAHQLDERAPKTADFREIRANLIQSW